MLSRTARIGLFLGGTVPAIGVLVAGRPGLALGLFLLSEVAVGMLLFASGVVEDLGKRWRERLTEWIDQAIVRVTSRFGKRYREFMVRNLRTIEEQGPATTGFYRPDLDEVFVDVGLVTRAPHQVSAGLLSDADTSSVDRRNLDEFIDNDAPSVLAVIGAPGSGKTTLLRRTGREVARRRLRRKRTIPILLYLRDHTGTIVQNPEIDVATLIRLYLSHYKIADPHGWFERRLRAGRCVVLLDGLDEVANPEDRRAVADWVEAQVTQYPKNDFVITSRPQGYLTSKIDNALVLQVRSFTDEQVTSFVRRWYQAVERKASGGDGEDVRLKAETAANDLLDRLYQNPALYQLTVNPLLLTMIANVHRYRGALPGSRADLYGEICEVMLWRRQEAKNLELELRGDKKESLLRSLAFKMMVKRVRDVPYAEIVEEIRPAMRRLSRDFKVDDFLVDTMSNGLIVERESGVYSFAHHTFQEYLAAAHIREKRLSHVLVDGVDDVWWRETTLLYAARSDADEIVKACLGSSSVAAFLLAYDCADQGSELAPELRDRMDALLAEVYEPDTPPERRRLMAGVLAARHLRNLVRTRGGRRVCPTPITSGIYWLYQQDVPDDPSIMAQPGGDEPVLGVWGADARAFAGWITAITGNHTVYRLPSRDELDDQAVKKDLSTAKDPRFTVWLRSAALWTPKGSEHPHRVSGTALAHCVRLDAARVAPSLARLLLLQSLLEARVLAEKLERDLAHVRANAHAQGRTRRLEVDAALAQVRARAKDRPLDIARGLEGARDLAGPIGLDSALDSTIEVLKAIAYANQVNRAQAITRGQELASSLIGQLDSDFAHVFALRGKLAGRMTPDRVMGQALSRVFREVVFVDGASADHWSRHFSDTFVREAIRVSDDIVVSPDELASKVRFARDTLHDMAERQVQLDDEDEEYDEGPSAWACKAATALAEVAGPVFARKRPLTPDNATAIRLSALCLAAETGGPVGGGLSQLFRDIAAGVSLLEKRANGQAVCNETIMLAVS